MSTFFTRMVLPFFLCLYLISACVLTKDTNKPTVPGITDSIGRWVNWVGVFNPTMDSFKRASYLQSLTTQLLGVRSDSANTPADSLARPLTYFLKKYLNDSIGGPYQVWNVQYEVCNGNQQGLVNIKADLFVRTDSSGGSRPGSPKPPSGTTVSGGILDALARNDLFANPAQAGAFIDATKPIIFNDGFTTTNARIAIIDTGIDTLLFDENTRARILWNGPHGSKNMITGQNIDEYGDEHPIRHGTSVAAITLNAFYRESGRQALPQLMVLKAADNNGQGLLFDYICALDYAINNNATIINSSMGFYGQANEVLDHYLRKSAADSILVVAAAGNANETHAEPWCRTQLNPATQLDELQRMYYPAVRAGDNAGFLVLSVTGINIPGMPCFFQNYSDRFVTLGVKNESAETTCCGFTLNFIRDQRPLSGSSFAAPVVTGRIAQKILLNGARRTVGDYLELLGNVESDPTTTPRVTQDNNFIRY